MPFNQKTIYNHVDTLTYTHDSCLSFSLYVCVFFHFLPFCLLNHKKLPRKFSQCFSLFFFFFLTSRVNLQLTFMSKSRHIFALFSFSLLLYLPFRYPQVCQMMHFTFYFFSLNRESFFSLSFSTSIILLHVFFLPLLCFFFSLSCHLLSATLLLCVSLEVTYYMENKKFFLSLLLLSACRVFTVPSYTLQISTMFSLTIELSLDAIFISFYASHCMLPLIVFARPLEII